MSLSIPVFLGLLSVLSPPVEVSPPVYGVNPVAHREAIGAVNAAGQYLVVYEDDRSNDDSWANGGNFRLTRVSAAGVVLERGGFEPSVSGPWRSHLVVASDNTHYLTAWAEMTTFDTTELRVTRMADDGHLLLAPTVVVPAINKVFFYPTALCFDGSEYKLAYMADSKVSGTTSMWLARLTTGGAVIGSPAQVLTTNNSYAYQPVLACSSSGTLLAWIEGHATSAIVRTAVVGAGGVIGSATSASLAGAKNIQSLSIATSGNGYLATWEEERPPTLGTALVAQVLSTQGARTKTSDLVLSAAVVNTQRRPQVAFDGSAYRVMATMGASVAVKQATIATVSITGAVSAAFSPLSGMARDGTGLACRLGACLALWNAQDTNTTRVEATRLGSNNSALDVPPLAASTPSDEQTGVASAWDGSVLLTVWLTQQGRGKPALMMRRQDAAGAWIESAPVRVASDVPLGPLMLAALPGGGFAVAYPQTNATASYDRDLRVAFVSTAGVARTASAPIVSATTDWMDGLVCDASECMVVRDTTSTRLAYRFDHAGVPISTTPATIACMRPFLVGAERWCVTKAPYGTTGLALQRYTATLTPIGPVIALDTPNERLAAGTIVPLVEASGVTLVWDSYRESLLAAPDAVYMKAMTLSLTGTVIDAPQNLFLSLNKGWLDAQALVSVGGRRWLVWYGNDADTFYKLRVQEMAGLLMVGGVDELTHCGLDLKRSSTVVTAGGNIAISHLERDSAVDRGSHRVHLRLTTGVPPNSGPADDGGTVGASDLGAAADLGLAHGGRDAAPGSAVDAGANDDADAGTDVAMPPAGDAPAGCGCEVGARQGGLPIGAPVIVLLLMLALHARRILRRRDGLSASG